MQFLAYASRVRERLTPYRTLISQIAAVLVLILIVFFSYHLLLPTQNFPSGHLIEIPEDASVAEMGAILKGRGAIRSALSFKAYARLTFQDRSLEPGPYVFDRPVGLLEIVHRMSNGRHGIEPVRVTLTEGMTVKDMGKALKLAMPDFNAEAFEELASTSEGYLFPDTYFFIPGTEPEEVMKRLRERFDEQIQIISEEILASDRSMGEVVTMASLIEREAQSEEDMRTVSGILWKRLDSGMLLQVDAAFGYMHGENGHTPTAQDLETDSPYNTYMYGGLPPTPIANPGLTALRAAAVPLTSPYFYYLTGRDGLMYYGKTFAEHMRNKELYLD